MRPLLVLRPQPGADATAAAARELGLEPVVAPLFQVRPLAWQPPDPAGFDAVMMTSANAARHGGGALRRYAALPCYAVGEATAEAAKRAGFGNVCTGPGDGAELLAMMASDGVGRAFHPCGRERMPLADPRVALEPVAVYAAEPVGLLPAAAAAALDQGAVALLHSPRAADLFSILAGERRARVAIAAIGAAAAEAAGPGWQAVRVADRPRETALLALAAELCQTRRR